jgi:hypothetical protein
MFTVIVHIHHNTFTSLDSSYILRVIRSDERAAHANHNLSVTLPAVLTQLMGKMADLTLLLRKDAPSADFPFDAARCHTRAATRGATAAVTRMALVTCATLTLECLCLAIPECHRCELGAARGNSSLLQSPAAGVDSHAPVPVATLRSERT